MSRSYFYFSLRCNSYHVTSGYRAVDTEIPESRWLHLLASRELTDLLTLEGVCNSFAHPLVPKDRSQNSNHMWATHSYFLTLIIFLHGERIEAPLPCLAFRDEKGCYIIQEIGGVQRVEWLQCCWVPLLRSWGWWEIWEY